MIYTDLATTSAVGEHLLILCRLASAATLDIFLLDISSVAIMITWKVMPI